MADLSDFKRGQNVGACMVGDSVTKTTQMFGAPRGTVSKVMIAFLAESQSCLRETVGRIFRKDCRTTALKITSNLNERLQNPVNTKFYKGTFHGRFAIQKPLLPQKNVSKHLEWYMIHRNWTLEQGKKSDFL